MIHDVSQPTDSGAGERKAFRGIHDQAFSPAGLSLVSSTLCSHFGAPDP